MLTCRSMGGVPDAFECRGSRQFLLVGAGSNLLHFFTQGVELGIGIAPWIDQGLRIKWSDRGADALEFEHSRAFGNQKTDAELNGRNTFHQPLLCNDTQQIQVTFGGGPRREWDEGWLEGHA